MLRRIRLGLFVSVLAALLALPTAAQADGGALAPVTQQGKAPERVVEPSDAPAAAKLAGGKARAGTDALAPGCYGQTDRPHLSSHQPGSINVVARTVCAGLGVYVSTALYRSRWYGWQLRGSGSNSSTSSVSTNAAESAADCDGTHDYLGSSYHEASDGAWATTSHRANGLTC